jgi:hypothetical protein
MLNISNLCDANHSATPSLSRKGELQRDLFLSSFEEESFNNAGK